MTTKELAEKLDLCEYGSEIGTKLEAEAKESGLVVVFGYSDDGTEFRGAINDETGCGEIKFTKTGKFLTEEMLENIEEIEDELEIKIPLPINTIEAIWCAENEQGKTIASWTYKTDIPHETFRVMEDVMEDEDLYCIGIVFSVNDLK